MASVIVFDMGGVLFDFQGDRLIARTSRRWRREEVQDSWVPLVQRFETGGCTDAEFAADVVRTYDLSLDIPGFLSEFRAAAVGFYDGALALVRELRARHHVVSLSNTNAVQWPGVLAGLDPEDPFHAHYPSHVSGFHKPDPRAFEAIANACESGAEFYFFDDRPANVGAAEALGWHARRVRGVAEARLACAELGLLG
jgi:HAD superfamily hydrolase (TIGR01509 family)